MFSQLKEKLTDKLRSFQADDLDRSVGDLVDRGTSEDLIAPEWSVNLALVDMVNQNPSVMPEKLLKALRRQVAKRNAKVQILALTILETCIKNCNPAIYAALANSELWVDLLKATADTSVSRVGREFPRIDADVRDRILCMIEDYSKVLPQQEFREAYEYLLEHGIDFPVRGPEDHPPILTPPASYHPPEMPHTQPGVPVPAASRAARSPVALGHQTAQALDPFAGMSKEDRAAVEAAMAEMEAEQFTYDPMTESTVVAGSPPQQPFTAAPTMTSPPRDHHEQYPPPATTLNTAPDLPLNPEEALQVIANTSGLLVELMTSQTDPREPFVVELAEQCVRLRSKLESIINGLADEGHLASALAHHEALQGAISKYDEQLAKAEQGVMPDTHAIMQQPDMDASARTTAASLALPEPGSAGPNFTLLDEEEEEDSELLSSKRTPVLGTAPAAVAPSPVDLLDALTAPLTSCEPPKESTSCELPKVDTPIETGVVEPLLNLSVTDSTQAGHKEN